MCKKLLANSEVLIASIFCLIFCVSLHRFIAAESLKEQGLPMWLKKEVQGLLWYSYWEIIRQISSV